jgi:hypothetical protein
VDGGAQAWVNIDKHGIAWKSMECYMKTMSRTASIADQLARNAQRQQDAFAAMAQALAASDTAGRERAQAKVAELTAEYQRLTEALRFSELEAREIATPRARKPGKPLRELRPSQHRRASGLGRPGDQRSATNGYPASALQLVLGT